MITAIKRIWNRVVNLGFDNTTELQERSRIKLLNKILFVTFIISFVLAVLKCFIQPNIPYPDILVFLSIALTAYFNFTFNHLLARFIACTTFPISVVAIIVAEGASFGEFVIFLLCIFMTFILFENKKKIRNGIIIWNISLAIAAYFYVNFRFPENTIGSDFIGTILLFIGSVLILSYLIIFYQSEIESNKIEKDKILNDLKISNKELEKFAYIVSHDLKEPLRNIIGFNTLIEKSIDSNDAESAKEFLGIVHSSSKMMNDLIEDTLEIVSSNRNKKTVQNIDLNEIIFQVKQLIAETLEQKNASVNVLCKLPKLQAIKSEMISTFKNLIENGIKFNQSEQPCINIDYHLNGDDHTISVADNGNGIEEEYHKKIFEMYARLETKAKYQGTGLGLAICKKNIEKMGGKIYLESELNKGTTFFIELPIQSIPI